MNKEETLESLEDELKSLNRKWMQLIVDASELDKQIGEVSEKFYEKSPEHVKVVCFYCGGQGYIKTEEQEQPIKCQMCNLKGFIWAKIWKGDK